MDKNNNSHKMSMAERRKKVIRTITEEELNEFEPIPDVEE